MKIPVIFTNEEYTKRDMEIERDKDITKPDIEEEYEMYHKWWLHPEWYKHGHIHVLPEDVKLVQSLDGNFCRVFIPDCEMVYWVPLSADHMNAILEGERSFTQETVGYREPQFPDLTDQEE